MSGQPARARMQHPAIIAVIGAIFGLLVVSMILIMRSQRNDTIVLHVGPEIDPTLLRVYVGGAVQNPGIYTLPRGSRVSDALTSAGGPLPSADISSLNLAAELEDSDQIIVARALSTAATTGSEDSTPGESGSSQNQPININTASATALETLPGIGPVLAERIVAYRTEHGPFQDIAELQAIRGISPAMVEELAALITVGP
ncbi:MAG: DNA-binding protein [Chloroflexi bacterium]|nr:MAG: DNA-binding protein [Chloroflexota bacterium]